ncbi:MAG: YncE family protein [Desulfobacteraceae bacterium]|nr:YncE family protein [Desulfobacteraceae bacterium]
MPHPRTILILFLFFFLGGCPPQNRTPEYRTVSAEDGQLLLYLQPLPQEAQNLRLTISSISVRYSNGKEITAQLQSPEIRSVDRQPIQTQLASAILPPGSCTGLALQLKEAFARAEEGEIALSVPEKAILIDLPFDVARGKITTLFLSLQPSELKGNRPRLDTLFTLAPAHRPILNLTGYISNADVNTISIFNKKSLRIVDTLTTSPGPIGVVLDRIRNRAYVAAERANMVEAIDLIKSEVVDRLRLRLNDHPIDLALSPDGRLLIAVNSDSNSISVIDALAMVETNRINVGEGPRSAVIAPTGARAFVMNTRSSTISVIDLTQMSAALTIGVEGAPLRAAFNPDGSKMFVIRRDSASLAVIDLARLAATSDIFVGMGARCITADPSSGLLYIGFARSKEIAVVDRFASTFIDLIEADGHTAYISIDQEEKALFALQPDRKQLVRIDLVSKKINAVMDLADGANTIAVMGER